jgi:hypothetical protein
MIGNSTNIQASPTLNFAVPQRGNPNITVYSTNSDPTIGPGTLVGKLAKVIVKTVLRVAGIIDRDNENSNSSHAKMLNNIAKMQAAKGINTPAARKILQSTVGPTTGSTTASASTSATTSGSTTSIETSTSTAGPSTTSSNNTTTSSTTDQGSTTSSNSTTTSTSGNSTPATSSTSSSSTGGNPGEAGSNKELQYLWGIVPVAILGVLGGIIYYKKRSNRASAVHNMEAGQTLSSSDQTSVEVLNNLNELPVAAAQGANDFSSFLRTSSIGDLSAEAENDSQEPSLAVDKALNNSSSILESINRYSSDSYLSM